MSIIISQSPLRARPATPIPVSTGFVAIDNGIWFEFETTSSPADSQMVLNVFKDDDTPITTSDVILNFGVDNKVFFDAAPYIQDFVENTNDNDYSTLNDEDINAFQGFYLVFGEFPQASPPVTTQSGDRFAIKAALQPGDEFGQNMAAFVPFSGQTDLAEFLTLKKTLPFWENFPIDLSFIYNNFPTGYDQREFNNEGVELSDDFNVFPTQNRGVNFLNFTKKNATTKKIEINLVDTSTFAFSAKTDNPGSSNNDQLTLPTIPTGVYDFHVDWGDESSDDINTFDDPALTHTYSSAGTFNITITGIFTGWSFNNGGDAEKLLTISSWSSTFNFGNSNGSFYGCTNLVITATDTNVLNMTGVTTLENTFRDCSSLNTTGLLDDMDVSSVTNFTATFLGCTLFNQTLNSWDMSSALSINSMFFSCSTFNQALNSWDVTSVTNMGAIFFGCTAYNGNITSWSPGVATNMSAMFQNATVFNQDLNSWNVSSATNMQSMFDSAVAFNQALNSWVPSSVTNMQSMFDSATAFNSNITGWNTSALTNMRSMFDGATAFNQAIVTSGSTWDVSSVTNFQAVFQNATAFNQDISSWVVSAGTTFRQMFKFSSFNQDITSWTTTALTDTSEMFQSNTSFNQAIGVWNMSGVTTVEQMFESATAFKQDLSAWDTKAILDFTRFLFGVDINNPNSATNTINYDALVIQLEANAAAVDPVQDNLTFHGGNSHYSSAAAITAHDNLTGATPGGNGWTITDGGTP